MNIPSIPEYQRHVLDHWTELSPAGQDQLRRQLAEIDFEQLAQLISGGHDEIDWDELSRRAVSPAAFRPGESSNSVSTDDAVARGEAALAAGQVAAILVAGGQGTRLGYNAPKGMYPIGPVSGRTLFQMHADLLIARGKRYGVSIPLYVMTSPATHDDTLAYFEQQDYLGLPRDDVQFFCQGTMPAVDAETGKLLLTSPDSLALSPDGHGGMLAAMDKQGCLADAAERGIKQFFYFQVDNPLAQICDPLFLGYHLASGSQVSTQVVAKRDAEEKVGVVVNVEGSTQIIEYSDLSKPAAEATEPGGGLKLWAGNIAVHVFDVKFLQDASQNADALPFHIAKKKVPHLDESGNLVEPSTPNALKFERFIFDLLPLAETAIVQEVLPAEAFAPIKNAPGEARDTPELAQAAICELHRNWLRQAGANVGDQTAVEIAPSLALDADELSSRLPTGLHIDEPTYFTPEQIGSD